MACGPWRCSRAAVGTDQYKLHSGPMRNTLLLALVAAVVVASAYAAPVRFGSGVNLAGMEFGSAKPGTYDKDYTLPRNTEVRLQQFATVLYHMVPVSSSPITLVETGNRNFFSWPNSLVLTAPIHHSDPQSTPSLVSPTLVLTQNVCDSC